MKEILLILFCIFTVTKSYGQDTIYSIAYNSSQPISNFENRDTENYFYIGTTQTNNLWQIGTPSKPVFNISYSAPLALVTDTLNTYPNGNISSFEFVIMTDDATFISFWHRFRTDSLSDGGVVEVSSDGGSTWTNILTSTQFTLTNFYLSSDTISSNSNKPGFTGNSDWIKSTIHGNALNFVRFRFTFTSDNTNTNKDGWMIDSFDFSCLGTGIKEGGAASPIDIFPNPTSNFIFVRSDNIIKFKTVTIKDMVGKTILTTDQPTIDLSGFQSGIYFIEITTDKEKYVAKVLRQ
jgi:hypothetical protein